jgi:hypothetical protein
METQFPCKLIYRSIKFNLMEEIAMRTSDQEWINLLTSLRNNDPKLISITLEGMHIDHSDLKRLADALKNNNALRALTINNCEIDDEGAEILAEVVKSNTELQDLMLLNNKITKSGMIKLKEALAINPNSKILRLRLDYNELSPEDRAEIVDLVFRDWERPAPSQESSTSLSASGDIGDPKESTSDYESLAGGISCSSHGEQVQSIIKECLNSSEQAVNIFVSEEQEESSKLKSEESRLESHLSKLQAELVDIKKKQVNSKTETLFRERVLTNQINELRGQLKPIREFWEEKEKIEKEREKIVNTSEVMKVYYQTLLSQLSGMLLAIFLVSNNAKVLTSTTGDLLDKSNSGSDGKSPLPYVATTVNVANKAIGIIPKIAELKPEKILGAFSFLGKCTTQLTPVLNKVIEGASYVQNIPGLSIVGWFANEGTKRVINIKEKEKLDNLSEKVLPLPLTPKTLKQLADLLARRLSLAYEQQISLLTIEGARDFAKCGMMRVLVNLLNGQIEKIMSGAAFNKAKHGIDSAVIVAVRKNKVANQQEILEIKIPFTEKKLTSDKEYDPKLTEDMLYRRSGIYFETRNRAQHYNNDRMPPDNRLRVVKAEETYANKLGYMLVRSEEFYDFFTDDVRFSEFTEIEEPIKKDGDIEDPVTFDELKQSENNLRGALQEQETKAATTESELAIMRSQIDELRTQLTESREETVMLMKAMKMICHPNDRLLPSHGDRFNGLLAILREAGNSLGNNDQTPTSTGQ